MHSSAAATKAADHGRPRPAAPEAGHLGADDAAADRLRAGAAPRGLGEAVVPDPLLAPPPPDAVVAVSLRHAATAEERTREAALRARHAAEVARLRAALRAMEEAHAAEVARLRVEHAADTAGLRRALEEARTGTQRPGGSETGALSSLRARLPAGPRGTRARLARIDGTRGGDAPERGRRPSAKPFAGAADLIAAVRALCPAGAAALSRLRGAVPPRH